MLFGGLENVFWSADKNFILFSFYNKESIRRNEYV